MNNLAVRLTASLSEMWAALKGFWAVGIATRKELAWFSERGEGTCVD